MPFAQVRPVPGQAERSYANITLKDIQLASVYFAILIDLALYRHCLTCGGLVERAKRMYPDRPAVQKAIAVSARRRLDVIRSFTSGRDLPDLTLLIINKGLDECGISLTQHSDRKAAHEQVFAIDWSRVSADFEGFLKATELAIKPHKKGKD